jgi:RNA polymerase sigma-70 factor (ECF subfamily)
MLKSVRTSLRISVVEAADDVVRATPDAVQANPPKTGRLRFPTTRWTVVRRVASETGDESLEAIEWLYRAYWSPLFSTVLRMGFAFHEAEDLTQGFLTKMVSNGTWSAADPTKGTLRSYLCTGLRRFVFDELGKRQRRPIDYRNDVPEGALDHEVTVAFDRAWGLELFQRAQRTLMNDLSRSPDFAVLVQKVMAGGEGTPNAEIAAAHGLTEDAVKMRTLRLRKQWQRVLRDEVAKTVSSPAEIDAELRHLITVLSQR